MTAALTGTKINKAIKNSSKSYTTGTALKKVKAPSSAWQVSRLKIKFPAVKAGRYREG